MMIAPRVNKRLSRFLLSGLAVLCLLVLSAPLTLPPFFNWLFHTVIVTNSSRGYSMVLVEKESIMGVDGFVTPFFEDQSKWRKLTDFGSENSAHAEFNVRAFWSKDGTLFVLQDKFAPSFLVFDCTKKIAYGTRKGRPLLKQHGDRGQIVFDGHQGFAKKSRYLWPWELRRATVSKNTSVRHDSEGANEW